MSQTRFSGNKPQTVKLAGQVAGLYETLGKRKTQEDALVATEMPDFQLTNKESATAAIQQTVSQMQQQHGQINGQGSTIAGVVAWRHNNGINAATTSLGDSLVIQVILDKDGHLKQSRQLNDKLHDQKTMIATNNRTQSLSVSGAIGDAEFGDKITHDAITTTTSNIVAPDDIVLHIVACDGLTESNTNFLGMPIDGDKNKGLTTTEVGLFVSAQYRAGKTPDAMAINLADLAQQDTYISENGTQRDKHQSGDNISVAVLPVTLQPVACFVFDGHGGSAVSNNLGNDFLPALQRNIANQLQQQVQHETPPNLVETSRQNIGRPLPSTPTEPKQTMSKQNTGRPLPPTPTKSKPASTYSAIWQKTGGPPPQEIAQSSAAAGVAKHQIYGQLPPDDPNFDAKAKLSDVDAILRPGDPSEFLNLIRNTLQKGASKASRRAGNIFKKDGWNRLLNHYIGHKGPSTYLPVHSHQRTQHPNPRHFDLKDEPKFHAICDLFAHIRELADDIKSNKLSTEEAKQKMSELARGFNRGDENNILKRAVDACAGKKTIKLSAGDVGSRLMDFAKNMAIAGPEARPPSPRFGQ